MNYLSIDWGGSELKGIYTGNQREFSLNAGNLRLLDRERLLQVCQEIVSISEISSEKACWLIGAAGADDPLAQKRLAEAVRQAHTSCLQIVIKSDYECNHASCFAGKDGILSINGTGSVIFARSKKCGIRLGGWGYVLDELPSGAWFGRKALEGVLRNFEGFSESSICREIFERRHGKADRQILIDSLYRATSIQKKLGEYSPVLTEAYVAGCPFAIKAINAAVSQICVFLREAATQTGMSGTIKLCGSGGLWQKWPEMAVLIKKEADQSGISLNMVKPSFPLCLGPLILQGLSDTAAQKALASIARPDIGQPVPANSR